MSNVVGQTGRNGTVRGNQTHKGRHTVSAWVYFIWAFDQNAIKIGYAVDVDERLGILQTGNPDGLVLHYSVRGTKRLEKALHQKFRHLRIKREWFRFSEEHPDIDYFLEELEDLLREHVRDLYETGQVEFDSVEAIVAAIEAAELPRESDPQAMSNTRSCVAHFWPIGSRP